MSEFQQIGEVASRAVKMIAEYAFPQGTEGKCLKCGKTRHCTTSELAVWMSKGWPKHCGQTIEIQNPHLKPMPKGRVDHE
jgi:hypothetical protein